MEVDAKIQHERAVNLISTQYDTVLLDLLVRCVELRLYDARGLRRRVALLKLDKEKDAHRAEETAFTALEAKTKASEQRASDEGTATQGLRVKLEGMEADREKCKAEMEKLTAELEKVAAEKDAALAHQKELQDALDAANKQLKKEAIVIASKDEFIKTLIQTPAAA